MRGALALVPNGALIFKVLQARLRFSNLNELAANCVSNQGCKGIYAKLPHCGCSKRFGPFLCLSLRSRRSLCYYSFRDQFNNHILSAR